MEISLPTAFAWGIKRGINFKIVPLTVWAYALMVELEHGTKLGFDTDVTHNSLDMTSKIAKAHILEYPDYYQRLRRMEQEANAYWSRRRR